MPGCGAWRVRFPRIPSRSSARYRDPPPLPLPLRELGLYLILNHALVGSPERQSRLSKRVIGKVVQRLKLATKEKATMAKWNGHGGFCVSCPPDGG
jgi:hypothetical protein